MKHSSHLRLNRLALFISFALTSTITNASVVRGDIDYQYFRDLAENKGAFAVGATSIPIFNLSGKHIGTMFDGVPVPDLKSANRENGVSALVSSQFIATVKHNTGLDTVQFGGEDIKSDSHHFNYKQVSKHNYVGDRRVHDDYQIMRLNKLVTEVTPTEMSNAGLYHNVYADRSRFSHFIRVGSGVQSTRSPDKHISDAYVFLTASAPQSTFKNHSPGAMWTHGELSGNIYGPMVSLLTGGDSGSPLYGFDKELNR